MVQWSRVHLPVQGTWVQSLVQELRFLMRKAAKKKKKERKKNNNYNKQVISAGQTGEILINSMDYIHVKFLV